MTHISSAGRIVVGVDGSPGSKLALTWAARLAALEGRDIDVITAWDFPTSLGWGAAVPDQFSVKQSMEKAAVQSVDDVFGPDRPPGLRVITQEGHPAHALIERSVEAFMVVVGSRGHGGFAGLLLGSVSARVAEHAHCPVLVVHQPKTAAPTAGATS